MAIRGSYGVFFDRITGNNATNADAATAGFTLPLTLFPNQAGNTDFRIADGIPQVAHPSAPQLVAPATRSAATTIFAPNLRTPYWHEFNFTIQFNGPSSRTR